MDKAFLIASDKNQEDILWWWIDQATEKVPDIPIQIVDLGLMPDTRRKLLLSGYNVLDCDRHEKYAWFSKPKAMLATKAMTTLWMDIDCQIERSIEDLFDLAQDDKIGLADDQYYRSRGKLIYNSGVVLYSGVPEILKLWDEAISLSKQRGDQEVLDEMLGIYPELRESIFTIPDKYNVVRLHYARSPSSIDDVRVIHWTGPTGKKHLRDKIIPRHLRSGTTDIGHEFREHKDEYESRGHAIV